MGNLNVKCLAACACYYPSPMAVNLSLLLNSIGLIILLASIRMGFRMFLVKSSGFMFLNEFLFAGFVLVHILICVACGNW